MFLNSKIKKECRPLLFGGKKIVFQLIIKCQSSRLQHKTVCAPLLKWCWGSSSPVQKCFSTTCITWELPSSLRCDQKINEKMWWAPLGIGCFRWYPHKEGAQLHCLEHGWRDHRLARQRWETVLTGPCQELWRLASKSQRLFSLFFLHFSKIIRFLVSTLQECGWLKDSYQKMELEQ